MDDEGSEGYTDEEQDNLGSLLPAFWRSLCANFLFTDDFITHEEVSQGGSSFRPPPSWNALQHDDDTFGNALDDICRSF